LKQTASKNPLLVIPDAAQRRSKTKGNTLIRHSGAARAVCGRNPEPSDFAVESKVTGFRIAAARRPE
jgi:hypothetical protein